LSHSTFCPIRRFVPFDILSHSLLFLFDNLSHSTFCPIQHFLRSIFCPFDVLSHSTFCLFDILSHSTFWHSAFCLIRRFVVRRFVHSAFVTSTFCRWTLHSFYSSPSQGQTSLLLYSTQGKNPLNFTQGTPLFYYTQGQTFLLLYFTKGWTTIYLSSLELISLLLYSEANLSTNLFIGTMLLYSQQKKFLFGAN
jgi:hypothetical protein